MPDGQRVDLGALAELHPDLPPHTVAVLQARGAAAFERQGNASGCEIELTIDRATHGGTASWPPSEAGTLRHTDRRRVTEDGAEAVALALVGAAIGWRVLRRLDQEEGGDVLLLDRDDQEVALEVSGIAGRFELSRLREKLDQVAAADFPVRAACVVAFGPPRAVLEMLDEPA